MLTSSSPPSLPWPSPSAGVGGFGMLPGPCPITQSSSRARLGNCSTMDMQTSLLILNFSEKRWNVVYKRLSE